MACLPSFDENLAHPMAQWCPAGSPAALPGSVRSAGAGSAGLLLRRLCLDTRSAGSTPRVTRPPFSDLNKWFCYRCKHNSLSITITMYTFTWNILYYLTGTFTRGRRKAAGLNLSLLVFCLPQSS